jgi:hypothetical protein
MEERAAMAKDPICGMVVPTATALSARRAGGPAAPTSSAARAAGKPFWRQSRSWVACAAALALR